MAVQTAQYVAAKTNLADSATWDVGVAPAAPWDAGSTVTFADGGPVATTNNATALASVNLAAFKVQPGCTLPMGAEGDPLMLYVNSGSGIFDYNGSARSTCYFAGGATPTIKAPTWRPTTQILGIFSSVNFTGSLAAGSGAIRLTSSATLVDAYFYGSVQAELQEHSSDVTGDIWMSGTATLLLKRATGSGKKIYVPAGTTVTLDLTKTISGVISSDDLVGTVVLQGGRFVLLAGNVTVIGNGTFDRSRLKRAATATVTGSPNMTIIDGPVVCTDTLTAIGPGPQYQRPT